jgi:hypothetical protein
LTDGSVIFTPNLFGNGISVNQVTYRMVSIDAGLKYRGLSFEGEYYRRWLSDYVGVDTGGIPNIIDSGYQMQTSAMPIPQILQVYFSWSQIFGDYGDPSECGWPELVLPEAARRSRQQRVHPREQEPCRLHGVPDARGRERQHHPRQSGDELLRAALASSEHQRRMSEVASNISEVLHHPVLDQRRR